MTDRPRITATVITLNEEKRLAACLESLAWADAVIVVDSGSTDRTTSIAKEHGAQVHFHAWEGFSPQKNFAISLATGDWVLHLDADERVTPELREEIQKVVAAADPAIDGFYLPRLNHWLGHPIRHSGWYPDHTLRLFRRGRARCEGIAHERFIVDGRTELLRSPLVHYSYSSVREHVVGILAATTLEVDDAMGKGVRIYKTFPWSLIAPFVREVVLHPLDQLRARTFFKTRVRNRVEVLWLVPFIPPMRFFYNFVVRQGFRDGIPGFWIAVLSAYYEAVRLALLWERLRRPGDDVDSDDLRRSSRL